MHLNTFHFYFSSIVFIAIKASAGACLRGERFQESYLCPAWVTQGPEIIARVNLKRV